LLKVVLLLSGGVRVDPRLQWLPVILFSLRRVVSLNYLEPPFPPLQDKPNIYLCQWLRGLTWCCACEETFVNRNTLCKRKPFMVICIKALFFKEIKTRDRTKSDLHMDRIPVKLSRFLTDCFAGSGEWLIQVNFPAMSQLGS